MLGAGQLPKSLHAEVLGTAVSTNLALSHSGPLTDSQILNAEMENLSVSLFQESSWSSSPVTLKSGPQLLCALGISLARKDKVPSLGMSLAERTRTMQMYFQAFP